VLANFLIGLREGLEATLVVTILIAYLVKTGNRSRLRAVWLGIASAVAVSLAFGAVLTFTSSSLSFEAQERFRGIMSIVAVAFVTWMVFWMRRTARFLKTELEGRLHAALAIGAVALTTTAFLAVGREGLETSLFIWAAAQSTGSGWEPIVGATLGIGTAVALGWLLYRRAITINLAKFFRWTGAGLIVVAAGVLAYGVHDLQEAGDLPGLSSLAFDVSGAVPPDSWYGTLLKGTLNFSPATTWLEAVVWLAYAVPVMLLFFRPAPAPVPRPVAAPAPAPAQTPSR
jgi:high-affinity iron transporter